MRQRQWAEKQAEKQTTSPKRITEIRQDLQKEKRERKERLHVHRLLLQAARMSKGPARKEAARVKKRSERLARSNERSCSRKD